MRPGRRGLTLRVPPTWGPPAYAGSPPCGALPTGHPASSLPSDPVPSSCGLPVDLVPSRRLAPGGCFLLDRDARVS
jgi:hypothetical protein